MFAVVRTGGKQYRVEEGRSIKIERLPGEQGDTVELGDVLLLSDGDAVTVGSPTVSGARIVGTIAEQGRARKIVVFRYKNKTRHRKKNGHRQQFTRLMVDDILAAGQEPKPKSERTRAAVVEAEPAPAVEVVAEAPKPRTRKKTAAEPAAEKKAKPVAEKKAKPEAAEKPKRSRKKTE